MPRTSFASEVCELTLACRMRNNGVSKAGAHNDTGATLIKLECGDLVLIKLECGDLVHADGQRRSIKTAKHMRACSSSHEQVWGESVCTGDSAPRILP